MNTLRIVEMANRNERLMDGTTGPVRRIISENDIVFVSIGARRGSAR
jgi:hypothetical protein